MVNRFLFSYCSISSFIDASIDFNFSPYRSFTNELNNKIITYLSVNYQVSRDLLVSGPVVLNLFLLPGSNSLLGTIIWELISKRAQFIKGLNRGENGTLQIIFTKAVNSISKLHYEIRFFISTKCQVCKIENNFSSIFFWNFITKKLSNEPKIRKFSYQ